MSAKHFPELTSEHFLDAKLYADRLPMLKALCPPDTKRIIEVGVAIAGLSKWLVTEFQPDEFTAVDLFEIDRLEHLWGMPTKELFGGLSHEEYYRRQLPVGRTKYRVMRGMSSDSLKELVAAGEKYDLVYVDGVHDYDGVKVDADYCKHLVAPGRLLVFNDYTMGDPTGPAFTPYGVVQVVNELLAEGGWRIVGFSLQLHMFCDIALKKV